MKIVLASLLMAGLSWAASPVSFTTETITKVVMATVDAQNVIDWKKGDINTYDLDMGGFIKGSMIQSVRDITSEGMWVDQNMDLGFAGKQTASQLIDPATGAIKKFIVNGKEQEVPANDSEVVEVTESKITVPAGSFDCIAAKIKDKKSGDITQAWINPEQVSIGGMLKIIQPSQFGEVTIVLKSFKKN
jgi:hypothetical protein